MPEVKIGAVKLELVPETDKSPEHLTWKRALEREWAGEWGTLAKLTDYCYKMALDPSFYYERPEYRTGKLHYYEWILCHNGGLIYLYSHENRLGLVWTSKTLGEKILQEVPGARVFRTSDEYLHYEIMFSLEYIHQVCKLAGARRSRRGKRVSEEAKEKLRQVGFGSQRQLLKALQRAPRSPNPDTKT